MVILTLSVILIESVCYRTPRTDCLKKIGPINWGHYRQMYKNSYRYYIMSHSDLTQLPTITKIDFERVHSAHWNIECYHRAIKQVCNIERFQVRKRNQIKNHIFCALKGFFRLEFMRLDKLILNWYEFKRDLFTASIRNFISKQANYCAVVNA